MVLPSSHLVEVESFMVRLSNVVVIGVVVMIGMVVVVVVVGMVGEVVVVVVVVGVACNRLGLDMGCFLDMV